MLHCESEKEGLDSFYKLLDEFINRDKSLDKEDKIPHISEKLGSSVDREGECRASADQNVDLKSLPDKESVDCVDQNDSLTEKNNFDLSPLI